MLRAQALVPDCLSSDAGSVTNCVSLGLSIFNCNMGIIRVSTSIGQGMNDLWLGKCLEQHLVHW